LKPTEAARAPRTRRPAEARRPAWWFAMAVVLNVALGMAYSVIALRNEADQHREVEALYRRISERSSLLDGLAWRALGQGGGEAELAQQIGTMSGAVENALRDLERMTNEVPLAELPSIRRIALEHLEGVEEQMQLLGAGRIEEAQRVGEQRIAPTLSQLRESTEAASSQHTGLARRSSRIADAESLVMMGVGAILATLLFRRFTWARRSADSRAAEERATSEARFRAVAQSANDAVVSADAQGTIVFWNEAARRTFGYTEEEAVGQPVTMLVPERHREACLAGLRRVGESGQARMIGKTLELDGQRKDGTEFPLELSLASWSMGDQTFYTTMIRDITDRRQAEDVLRDREARLRAIVENVPAIVYTAEAGPSGRWLYVSPQVESLLGFSPEEWMADPGLWFRQIHPEDQARVTLEEKAEWAKRAPGGASEYRMLTRDGRVVWVRDVGAVIADEHGRPLYWSGVLSDITDRRELEEQLEHQAFHDTLTGLANRALFLDRVEHALARGTRDEETITVLFLDLDDFKTINDSLGHASGDRVLVTVAERLEQLLRPGDTIARLGGDEFAILLEGASLEDAIRVVERILDSLEEPIGQDSKSILVRASFGIAVADDPRLDATDLLRNADVAMYAAKARGKGRFEVFRPDMHVAALRRLETEAELQRALHERQFVLHYQPILDLESGRIVALEALIRWERSGRLVPPAEFIPLAEESDLIIPIGRWVLEEACRQAAAWHREYPAERPLGVNANVSGKQFQHAELVEEVAEILRTTGIHPGSLTLEMTESVLVRETETAVARLRDLKALGVRVALDDFGTGYSSLGYLKRFPIDILKIDKTFVDGIGDGPGGSAIVRAIISLGESLSMGVSAEGIESEEQVAVLQALRCRWGQGYYFARPMDAQGIRTLLSSSTPSQKDRRATGSSQGGASVRDTA
jgi:diguanylate cyclase (GGDEF)-like protein/PAS domain S-box-containing protein